MTGYVAALTIRSAFWEHPHQFHWPIALGNLLPAWAVLTVNAMFYAYILWLCIVFPRALQWRERVLVLGWVPALLLSPIQGLLPVSLATAIQYVKAASITVAFLAVLTILVEGPASANGPAEGTVPD
jgi:hypothetical protein